MRDSKAPPLRLGFLADFRERKGWAQNPGKARARAHSSGETEVPLQRSPRRGGELQSSSSDGPRAVRRGALRLGSLELRERPHLVRGRRGTWCVAPAAPESWSPPSALLQWLLMPGSSEDSFVFFPDVHLKHE